MTLSISHDLCDSHLSALNHDYIFIAILIYFIYTLKELILVQVGTKLHVESKGIFFRGGGVTGERLFGFHEIRFASLVRSEVSGF